MSSQSLGDARAAGKPELVGLYWTVSGPVVVHFGREWSYFSWADRCAEARKVGFAGLGIWHADLEHVLETETLADMKRAMDDNGLTRLELEFLMDWFLDPDDDRRQASDKTRDLLLEAASVLGAHHVKVGNIPGTPASLSQLTERFGELCDIAAERTDAKIVYEFMPPDANVRSLDAVLEVVGGAARRNGGIAIDTWHMSKLGIAPDDLRRIPLEYLSWVESERRPVRRHGRPDRRGDQPPQPPRRRRVRHQGICQGVPGPRLPRALGRGNTLRGASQQHDRCHFPAGFRHDRRPIRIGGSST